MLNTFQSVEARYPLVDEFDCVMVKTPVELLKKSGVTAEIEVEPKSPSDEVALNV